MRWFLVFLLAFLGVLTARSAADWPVFRGNATQTGVASAPLAAKLTVVWKFEKESFEATAVIARRRVHRLSGSILLRAEPRRWQAKMEIQGRGPH